MFRFARSCLLCLAACCVSTIAWAQPAPWGPAPAATPYSSGPYPPGEATAGKAQKGENFTARPLAIYSELSLGGPFGVGAALDYSLSRHVSVEAGGGRGFTGAEFGAMLLPRLPLSRGFAIGAGVGFSGTFDYVDRFECDFWGPDNCTPAKWSFAPFVNGELYLEGRTSLGFSVRGYLGAWRILNSTPDVPGTAPDLSLPYVGVAIGWALEP